MAAAANRYDAFVSYRRSDGAVAAAWIRRQLQQYRPPRALRHRMPSPLRVYLDTAYERGTIDFYEQTIRPALLASQHLIVVATPDAVSRAAGSEDWIRREVQDFTAGPNGSNVIVVRAAGDFDGAMPADIAARFPNVQIIDLRGVGLLWFLDPMRASRLTGEKLKIVAPLLGIPPEEMPLLRQEEERRQQARLGSATGIALAVAIAVSALSLVALRTSWRAERALESSLYGAGRMIESAARMERGGELGGVRSSLLFESCEILNRLAYEAGRAGTFIADFTCKVERALSRYKHDEVEVARNALAAVLADAEGRWRQHKDAGIALAILDARLGHAAVLAERGDAAASMREAETAIAAASRFAGEHATDSVIGRLAAKAHLLLAEQHAAARRRQQAVEARIAAAEALGAAAARVAKPVSPGDVQATFGSRGLLLVEACTTYDEELDRPRFAVGLCEAALATFREAFALLASDGRSAGLVPDVLLTAAVAAGKLAQLRERDHQAAQRDAALAEAQGWIAAIEAASEVPKDIAEKAAGLKAALTRDRP